MKPEFTWRVAREAWGLALVLAALAGVGWVVGWAWVAVVAVVALLLVLAFFRDPRRMVPGEPGLAVAPGDGRVVRVDPAGVDSGGPRVSIFLSIFNVHVNRVPIGGEVVSVERTAGRFGAAFRDAASEENERVTVRIATEFGPVEVVQVAGLVARRIVCRLAPGDRVRTGERYGLIQFGSRLDVVLPPSAEPLVAVGQRTRGGTTALARFDRRTRGTS